MRDDLATVQLINLDRLPESRDELRQDVDWVEPSLCCRGTHRCGLSGCSRCRRAVRRDLNRAVLVLLPVDVLISFSSSQLLFTSALNMVLGFIVLSFPLTSGPHDDAVPKMNGTETLSTEVSERAVSMCVALKCFLTYCRSSVFSLWPKMETERYWRLQVVWLSIGDASSAGSNCWTQETGSGAAAAFSMEHCAATRSAQHGVRRRVASGAME